MAVNLIGGGRLSIYTKGNSALCTAGLSPFMLNDDPRIAHHMTVAAFENYSCQALQRSIHLSLSDTLTLRTNCTAREASIFDRATDDLSTPVLARVGRIDTTTLQFHQEVIITEKGAPFVLSEIDPLRRASVSHMLLDLVTQLHSKSIVHGNINPDALRWNAKKRLVFCDFSGARITDSTAAEDQHPVCWHGDEEFVSPQLRARTRPGWCFIPTAADDIYAMAVTVWCVWAGRRPEGGIFSENGGRLPDLGIIADSDVLGKVVEILGQGGLGLGSRISLGSPKALDLSRRNIGVFRDDQRDFEREPVIFPAARNTSGPPDVDPADFVHEPTRGLPSEHETHYSDGPAAADKPLDGCTAPAMSPSPPSRVCIPIAIITDDQHEDWPNPPPPHSSYQKQQLNPRSSQPKSKPRIPSPLSRQTRLTPTRSMTAPTTATHPALTTLDESSHSISDPDPYYFHTYINDNHAHSTSQTQEPETYDSGSTDDEEDNKSDTSDASDASDSLDEDDITWEFPFPFLQGLPCCSPNDSIACLASPKGPPPPDFAVRIRPEQLRLRHRRVQSLSGLSTGGFGAGIEMGIGRMRMGGYKSGSAQGSGVGPPEERDGESGRGMVRSLSSPGWNLGG